MGNYYVKASLADRFWPKVDVRGPNECWEWKAGLRQGYGRIRGEADRTGNTEIGSHRASWLIHFGAIPDGMYVCHKCDNKKCVNPKHLWLGTDGDNTRDMSQKGRHPKAKLTPQQVKEIMKDERLYKEIAKDYEVNESTVSQIRTGHSWSHLK